MRFYFRGHRVRTVSRYTRRKVAVRRRHTLRHDFLARLKQADRFSLLVTTALASPCLAVWGLPAEAAPAPIYDWSGFYVGGHAGYGDVDDDGFFASSVDLSFGGGAFVTGGQVGWNWQHDDWVFGAEVDISSLDWRDPSVREERYIADANYLSTLRGRVGWADGNVLFYVTGGL
jgi:outer membrane immunogenic protein